MRSNSFSAQARDITDVDALALSDPARYRELLGGYHLLMGERCLRWQRCAESDDARWKGCVRDAILKVARRSDFNAARLADILDQGHFPKTQARIMRLARELLYTGRVAR
ncbi:MAG TPA: hypothetical protein VMU38_10860 [Candidatus Binatia bacterium]|nr:hypothetical protein [Candidatus Binatia bacterium]